MPIDIKTIENTNELKAFENDLTEFRKKSLEYIASAPNEEYGVKLAKLLSRKLGEIDLQMMCPKGTVFDPDTGTCV